MSSDDGKSFLGPLARGALRHHIVKGLLRAIILGELPAGSRLITGKLAGRFGVSATPIREALVELEQSGIVDLQHHRGALVKSFGRSELRDFYYVRALLESEAARLACGHVDPVKLGIQRTDLERLLRKPVENPEKWVKDLLAADHRTHLMVVEHCSNKRLVAEIGRYNALGETLRDLMGHDAASHHGVVSPLIEMLDSMQNHHADSSGNAAMAMKQHIDAAAYMAEAALFDGSP